MNKIVSIKNANAIFLATILVLGTITLFSPSFMTTASAQGGQYYGMDDRYNRYYEPEYEDKKYSSHEPDYVMDNNNNYQKPYGEDRYGPTEYPDNNYYNSYGYSDYGKDSSYDDRKSYDKKPYGNDNNYDKPQYQSYKPDYKPAYPSYGKDDRDKSKDSSSSISINKLNCINNNVNINGNNNGTINVGNSGKSATGSGTDEGYLGVGSLGGNYGEGYDNGYNKQKDKSFSCIINNNNNNTVVVGEEPPTPIPPVEECAETDEIEACFEQFLDEGEFPRLVAALESGITIGINGEEVTLRSFNDICLAFEGLTTYQQLNEAVDNILIDADISPGEDFVAIVDCIAEALGIPIVVPIPG